MNPFEYVNQITYGKKDIMVDDVSEKAYNPFMINRSLSYFADTVFFANEMNKFHHTDKKLQFHFMLNIVRKKKRFSKWIKPEEDLKIELVKDCYGYSNEKAKQIAHLITAEQMNILKAKKGGKSK